MGSQRAAIVSDGHVRRKLDAFIGTSELLPLCRRLVIEATADDEEAAHGDVRIGLSTPPQLLLRLLPRRPGLGVENSDGPVHLTMRLKVSPATEAPCVVVHVHEVEADVAAPPAEGLQRAILCGKLRRAQKATLLQIRD
eukprot:scaffold2990_cov239-Pinguiococcus_pyrenoidosus.AAC.6